MGRSVPNGGMRARVARRRSSFSWKNCSSGSLVNQGSWKYHIRACFVSDLDVLRSALFARFTSQRLQCCTLLCSLQLVLPNSLSTFESLRPLVEFYMAGTNTRHLKKIKREREMWKQKRLATTSEKLPKCATLKHTNPFPDLKIVAPHFLS